MNRALLVLFSIICVFSGIDAASKFSPISGVDVKWHKSADDSLFYIETEEKFNWYDAWNECARKNMSLIAIDSFYKHTQVDTLIRKVFATCPAVWIGGHDNAIDLRYEWPMTGEVFSFTNWDNNQPDRASNNMEHCILIWKNTWRWHDLPCAHKLGFICEENRYLKEKSKELMQLKKQYDDRTNELAILKNSIMNVHLSPKLRIDSNEKSSDLDKS